MDALAERMRIRNMVEATPPSMHYTGMEHANGINLAKHLAMRIQVNGESTKDEYAEVRRICAMPVVWPMTEKEIECFSDMSVLAEAKARGFKLNAKQCEGLYAYMQCKGLFAPLGVGHGKTLLSLMIDNAAYAAGVQKIMHFVPPHVFVQLTQADLNWSRARVPMNFPIHLLGGRGGAQRKIIAESGKKGVYINTYSMLSTKDAEDILHAVEPELLILDECHEVRNRSSARTKRLMRYIGEHQPAVVALSGTITNKSIMDYQHLLRACLRGRCPLPYSESMVGQWANVLDAEAGQAEESSPGGAGPLLPLVEWARYYFPQAEIKEDLSGFRKAYKLRLNHTQGVVSSGDASIGTSLVVATRPIENPDACEGYSELKDLILKVDEMWQTPSGDEIEWTIHKWKWIFELSAGFYNRLTWPDGQTLAERRKTDAATADTLLAKARERHAARQAYTKWLRDFIKDGHRPGLDTPFLIEGSMSRNGAKGVWQEVYDSWRYWHSLDFEGCPERDSTPVRVCSYKVDAAVAWAKTIPANEGALIWVYHQDIGRWAYEKMLADQVDVLYCPAGDASNAAILNPANAHKKIICSISAHGEGKNLQAFHHNYFIQWPRPASTAEQALGRTHRIGQLADQLTMTVNTTSLWDQMNFAACLNDALYIQQTTGNMQKLILAGYDPLPKIFPSAVLRERGLNTDVLSAEQERELAERFGQGS